jgi:hypothetical protein
MRYTPHTTRSRLARAVEIAGNVLNAVLVVGLVYCIAGEVRTLDALRAIGAAFRLIADAMGA